MTVYYEDTHEPVPQKLLPKETAGKLYYEDTHEPVPEKLTAPAEPGLLDTTLRNLAQHPVTPGKD